MYLILLSVLSALERATKSVMSKLMIRSPGRLAQRKQFSRLVGSTALVLILASGCASPSTPALSPPTNSASSEGTGSSEGATNSTSSSGATSATPATGTSDLSVVSSTLYVSRGGEASVIVKTKPGALGMIEVDYKSGPSHAKGLTSQTANSQGLITWQWEVGTSTSLGTWPVHISADGKSITVYLHVN